MNLATKTAEQRLEESYVGRAQTVAYKYLATKGIDQDNTGNTVADYANGLALKAWQAQRKFLDKGVVHAGQELRWVHTCLCNSASSTLRSREQERNKTGGFLDIDPNRVVCEGDLETATYRKELVKILHAGLHPDEFRLLVRYTENGGRAWATWEDYGSRGSRGEFTKLIRRLRAKARRILSGKSGGATLSGAQALHRVEESDND